ncbi:hypothetical protein GCM10008940_00660 [Microbulbifer agarilyticus]
MIASGIDFEELKEWKEIVPEAEGVVNVQERVILTSKAREHFEARLAHCLRLDTRVTDFKVQDESVVVNGEEFDYIIDATWGHLDPKRRKDCFYESTLLLYYRYKHADEFPAITLVDGPLCSIYPTEEPRVYTLSSVSNTPIGRFNSPEEAKQSLRNFSEKDLLEKRRLMEDQVEKYVPNFSRMFDFVGPQFSIKTKLVGQNDDRSCYVEARGRHISILSGKIDTIFFGAQKILEYLERHIHEEEAELEIAD